jgi:predicted N-acetyltransferase YhbS
MHHWNTRAEHGADVTVIREINLAAFDSPAEADLVDELRNDPTAWIADLSTLALDDAHEPVAYALLTRCHIGSAAALCLGPCAVVPGHQRQGAGSAAIRAALLAATSRGERFVTVLGHPDYYPRFGFRRASLYGIYPPQQVPGEAMMTLALTDDPAPPGIIQYAPAFGSLSS